MLAIAAARLGWEPVTALELDPDALAVIEANAAANGVRVEARTADLLQDPMPWAPFVVANLTAAAARATSPPRLERRPRRLIASGMLARDADDVAAVYEPLREVARAAEGAWAAVMLA